MPSGNTSWCEAGFTDGNKANPRQWRRLLVMIGVVACIHAVDRLFLSSSATVVLPTAELSPLRSVRLKAENGTHASKSESTTMSSPPTNTSTAQPTILATSNSPSSSPTNPPPAEPLIITDSPATESTINTPRSNTGGIFYCGHDVSHLARTVFPEYAQRLESSFDNDKQKRKILKQQGAAIFRYLRPPQADDILIFGLHGSCKAKIEDFPGKVLVANGEPSGGDVAASTTLNGKQLSQDIYQIGSVPNGPNTLLTFFMVWGVFLLNYVKGDKANLPKLYDHSKKPVNNGKHNAIIYMNRACHQHREEAINEISTIIPVHLGGECKGAQPAKGTLIDIPANAWDNWSRNFEVQQDYKFCFAMENTYPYQPHYMTEKILNPFLAGCIPVYYGTPEVFDIFNRKAFVYYDPADPQPALQQLQELYNNEALYNEMLHNQPILAEGNETLRKYFSLVDEIEGGFLKQQIRTMMGL